MSQLNKRILNEVNKIQTHGDLAKTKKHVHEVNRHEHM